MCPRPGLGWRDGSELPPRPSANWCGGIRSRRSAEGAAPAGATFAAICLLTGSIWGRPTWGTWWEWDGRLTSMLVLFFLYLGYIALASAERERAGRGDRCDLRARRRSEPADHPLFGAVVADAPPGRKHRPVGIDHRQWILWPLPLTMVGFTSLFAAAVLMRMRAELAETKGRGADAANGRGMNPWPFVRAAYASPFR